MRKHFLLLFLMALLPLAGWAATAVDLPSDLDVTFTIKDGTTPTTKYTGNDLDVEIATATATIAETPTDVSADVVIEGIYVDQTCTSGVTVHNAGTYYVKVVGDGDPYDADSYKVFTISVAKFGNIEVSAKALPKTYGAAYPTTGYYTATMPTGATETPAEAGLEVTASFSDITKWPLNKPVGVHEFEIETNSVANYNIVVVNKKANLTINKVNLTVKANDLTGDDAVEYGTTPVFSVTYGPTLVPGDAAAWTPAFTVVKAGTTTTFADNKGAVADYTITPGGLTSDNYTFVPETGTLTVKPRNISHVTFEMTGATYNSENLLDALKAFEATDDGTIAAPAVGPKADDFTVAIYDVETEGTALTTAKNAGTYYAEIKAATTGSNYTGTAAARIPVVLAQKQLNIISHDDEWDYSGTTPNLTSANVEFNGLEADDANTEGLPLKEAYAVTSYTSDAAAFAAEFALGLSTAGAKNAGKYTINTSSALSKAKTAIFKNYKVNYVNVGEMTINKVQVTLKPANLTIQYGDDEPAWANVEADAFEIGFYNKKAETATTLVALGDDLDDVFTTLPVIERVIPTGKTQGDVGTYDLNAINYVVADGNYELKAGEPKKGTLTIEAATSITILVDNVEAVYGEYADQAALVAADKLKYRVSGVKAADKNKITVPLTVVEHADNTKAFAGKRGEYDIKIGDVTLADDIKDNYAGVAITKMDGTLTVGKAPLKIEARTQSLMVGDKVLAASDATVKINNEKELAEADLTALFGTIKLMFSNASTTTTAIVPVGTGEHAGELVDGAVTAGWTGTADATAAADKGIWVNGIQFDETTIGTYNTADNNYILTGTGSEVKAGKLIVASQTAVAFDVTAENTDQIAAQVDKLINAQISLNASKKKLTLYGDEWNAMILPFDIEPLAFCNAIEGYAIFDVLEESGSAMNFKVTYETIPAYTPFLVKVKNDVKMYEKRFNRVLIKAIPEEAEDIASANDSYFFQGNLAKCTPEGWVITSNSAADPKVKPGSITLWNNVGKPAAEKVACKAFSAYIMRKPTTPSTEAPVLYIEEADGSTTAISAITADGVAVKAEGWYTINGIRLQGAPTEKGVYINNGKKIVIK